MNNNTDIVMKFGLGKEDFAKVIAGKKKFLILPESTEYYQFPRDFPEKAIIEVINLSNKNQRGIFKVTDHEHANFDDEIIVSITPLTSPASLAEIDGTERTGGKVSPAF